jgi:hypothetical protein
LSKGVLLIARNNGSLDYVKQAAFLAKRIKKYLGLPTSVITDSVDYLKDAFDETIFDEVIFLEYRDDQNSRAFRDGTMYYKNANFKNRYRSNVYDLSPYDETLLMDTDYIISNDLFKNCFDSPNDLQMFKKSYDIAKVRDEREFNYISDYSIDFYWATVVFFRKTETNEIFFNLVKHVEDHWNHYCTIYQLNSILFRNDFAFSIAAHIMNGFEKGTVVTELPGQHLYTTDRDILWKLKDDVFTFLVEKKDYLGEYTPIITKGQSIHVMNKFSLERCIDEQ